MKNQQTRDKSSFLSSNVMKVGSHFTVDICVSPADLGRWGRGNTSAMFPAAKRHSGKHLCSGLTSDCTPASGRLSVTGFSAGSVSRAATSCSGTLGRTQVTANVRVNLAFKKPQYTHVCFFSRYRWQTLRVQPVSETLHEERSPDEAL